LNDDRSFKGEWMIEVYDDESESLDGTLLIDNVTLDLQESQIHNVSCDVKGICSHIFGDESKICAQVYLQNVDSRNLLVGDERGLRGYASRRRSKNLTCFTFLWMTLTVVVLATRGTSVTSYCDAPDCSLYVGSVQLWYCDCDVVVATRGTSLTCSVDTFDSWYCDCDFQLSWLGNTRMNCFHLRKTSLFWCLERYQRHLASSGQRESVA